MALALAVIALWAVSPLKTRQVQHVELKRLKAQKKQLRTENQGIRTEIKRLEKDPEHIELLARRDLGLIKPDEEAYVVIEKPVPVAKPAKVVPPKKTLLSYLRDLISF